MKMGGPPIGLLLGALLAVTWDGMAAPGSAGETTKAIALGEKVPNSSSLRDLRGNRRALHDFTGRRALVLAFLGADCPISNLYLPSLLSLEKKYRTQEVVFLAVYAN